MNDRSVLPNIGFAGLGRLGGPLATNLAKAGYPVTGFDINPDMVSAAGLPSASSPVELGANNDIAITCVRTTADLTQLLGGAGGLLAGLRPGSTVMDLSSLSPSDSAGLAKMVAEAGSYYLRVAVSGSAQAAAGRQVSFVCSGPREAYDLCTPVLGEIGRSQTYVGPADEARAMKVALNMLVGIGMVALVEAVVVADRSGLDRQAFLDVVAQSALASPFYSAKTSALVERDYTPAASLAIMLKDLNLALGAGAEMALELPATQLARDLYARCEQLGWAEQDFSCLAQWYEEHANAS